MAEEIFRVEQTVNRERWARKPNLNAILRLDKKTSFMKRHSLNCTSFTGEEVFLVESIHIDVNSDACDKQCCQFLSLISIKLIYLHIRRCISTRLMFARFLRGMFRINLECWQSFSTKTFKKLFRVHHLNPDLKHPTSTLS